jgi:phosphoglucosamine mutase
VKLPDSVEEDIERFLDEPMGCEASASLGRASRIEDAAGRYIEFCKSTFPTDLHLRGLKIVLDCANGAAYNIAPKVFHELGAEVISIGISPNGLNINDGVGATSPAAFAQAVAAHGADLGIALDGDGDRILMCDASGVLYDGDKLLYVIARAQHAEGRLDGVVGTLMSNLGFEHAIARMGIPFCRAKVGDRYVLEQLIDKGFKLGGENSGHIICLDRHTTGDGIVSALQVLAALRIGRETLADACSDLVFYPQKLVNVKMRDGFDWQGNKVIEGAVRSAEDELGGFGRVLLRPSGTEALLRVLVEGADREQVERLANQIARAVGRALQLTEKS